MTAELWTRLKLIPGVELHFDATRHQPDAAALLALREAVRAAFATDQSDEDENTDDGGSTSETSKSDTADERSDV
jgi:hypothetical protein